MKRFTSNDGIENLCEAMIKDFFKSKHYTNVTCVDIEAFVREYLGVPIVYETLDNLYALSELLQVPMDVLVSGTRIYHPEKKRPNGVCRLLSYYRLIQDCTAA